MQSRFSSEARAHREKDAAVASLASTSALLAQSNQSVAQLQQQLLALQATNGTLQQQVGSLQATNGALQQRVGDLQATNGTLQLQVDDLQANDGLPSYNDVKVQYLERQIDELQLEVNGYFVESNDLLGQVKSLTSTNATLQAEVVDLTGQLHQANTNISHSLEQLRELEKEKSVVEDSLEQAKKELAAVTQTEELTPAEAQKANVTSDDALTDRELEACLSGFTVINKSDLE